MRGHCSIVVAAALALTASACVTTTPQDPCAAAGRDVDLLVLLGNTTSGAYDACLEDLRGELARARLRARVLQGEADRLEAEAASLEGERAEAARRLAEANARQADALARLDAAERAHTVDQRKLRDVLAREEALARELEDLNRQGGMEAAEAERLQREQEELEQRIEALLRVS